MWGGGRERGGGDLAVISICPLVSIPLSGVSDGPSIAAMANMDSWVVSNKMAPNISLPETWNKLWEVLCSSASSFVETVPKGEVLYLPMSLTNPRKRRFNAGALEGPFPVKIRWLDEAIERQIVCALTREQNDCYCLSLPADPTLDCFQDAPAPDAAEDLADKLSQLALTKNDIVYLDLLSNLVYLGTDQDGNSIEPFEGEGKKWHILGSLVAAAKPRLRRLLDKMATIRESCGEARILCAVPILHYMAGHCCNDQVHLDNLVDDDIGEIHDAVRANSRSTLLTAFPGSTIFDPLSAFTAKYSSQELPSLYSSGGVTVWRGDDPVHLADTAYGDIADHLVNVIKGSGGGDPEEVPQRRRLESFVTRSGSDPAQKPVPGWLLGGNQGGTRGHPPIGNIRGRGGRGRAAGWRGGLAAGGPHTRATIVNVRSCY